MEEDLNASGAPTPNEGKVIFRMIVVQAIQGKIIARKKMNPIIKVILLFLIFIGMLAWDLQNFFSSKCSEFNIL